MVKDHKVIQAIPAIAEYLVRQEQLVVLVVPEGPAIQVDLAAPAAVD